MPSATTAPHPSPSDPQADLRAEDALYFRSVLHGLIDRGADMARLVHEKAAAQAKAEDSVEGEANGPAAAMTLPEAAAAFERCARTVRRTIALARHVAEPVPTKAEANPEHKRAAARRQIIRAVEDAIQREAEGADVEALEAELRERLDGPELDDEIGDRPTAEVITDICRDLGLGTLLGNHPWKRRLPADVAALCERAARPVGSPPEGDLPRAALPEVPGRFRTWAGPPAYNREASIELMHKLLELAPPKRSR